MNLIQKPCLVLTILGAINWGLIGLFDLDLVLKVCGGLNTAARVIYCIIAVAGIINILLLFINLNPKKDEDL